MAPLRKRQYATEQGQAMWPNGGVSPFLFNRNWYGMRTAQMCDIWKSMWGPDSSRVICVLGAQGGGNSGTAKQSLDCPLWTGDRECAVLETHINAVAIASYFANSKLESRIQDGVRRRRMKGSFR